MALKMTVLESAGAEFLVLGELLIREIETYKTYDRQQGHDLVCRSAKTGKTARIQIKSRRSIKANQFHFKNFDSDFVVLVRLNRKDPQSEIPEGKPAFYVVPTRDVQNLATEDTIRGHKLNMKPKDLGQFSTHENSWSLIEDFLADNSK